MSDFETLFKSFKKENHQYDERWELSRESKLKHLKFLECELKDLRKEVWELRKELGVE